MTGNYATEEEGEEEYGRRRPMRKMSPREPTKEEREEHEKMHVPFRNWCRHCVRGRGKEEECRRNEGIPEVPEVHIDFMFVGEEKVGENTSDVSSEGKKYKRRS